ncbi:MAG: DUF1992 domain-containing protein [Acidobacteriota bacterium]|nr:DUF1992 domain-containing protein [Acidobacteriota bacterium]
MEAEGIDVLRLIAERKIAEAIEQGALDNLSLKGRPLDLSCDPLEPPERRLANKVLKNAGLAPLELSLHRELTELRREFARAKDLTEKARLAREIRWLVLQINVMMKTTPSNEWLP